MNEEKEVLNNDPIVETSTAANLSNTDKSKANKAMVGFILGLCSIVAWFIPLLGLPVTIVGIVFSSLGLKSSNKGFAIAGLVLSIVFLIATLLNSFIGMIMALALYYY